MSEPLGIIIMSRLEPDQRPKKTMDLRVRTMKLTMVIALLPIILFFVFPIRAAQQPKHPPAPAPDKHSVMMQHGEKVMGFSQTETSHHFFLKKDGGVIQVEANDQKDVQNRDLIRTHLSHIAQAFAADDFSDPMAVHDKIPDGVPVMRRLKGDIHYTFQQTRQGGQVLIKTSNTEALRAVHQFLRFQIKEHQTGDSTKVE